MGASSTLAPVHEDEAYIFYFPERYNKSCPVVFISILPFANYLVFVLMYVFPWQLLIWHFWTPKQQEEFMDIYHRMRVEPYPEIMEGLLKSIPKLSERNLRNPMFQLCTQKPICRFVYLTPHLPAFLLQRRLGSHICEIQNLDCALLKLGVNKLSEEELKQCPRHRYYCIVWSSYLPTTSSP